MSVINTNTAANIAALAINRNDRDMETAMTRLSTGLRINSAKDDAAGLAISQRMTSQIGGLEQGARNALDAITMLQVAEGATKEISNMLSRMRELAVQAGSGTYTDTDRDALNLEFQALVSEMDRIASNTEWNGDKILAGKSNINNETELAKTITIQLGSGTGQTMDLSLNSWRTGVAQDAQMTAASGTGRDGVDTAKSTVLTLVDGTMDFATGDATADTITIAGLTFTAAVGTGQAFDASDVVSYILGLEAGQTASGTPPGLTNITVSGTLTANHRYEAVAGDVNALKITNTDSGATSYAKATATVATGSTAATATLATFTNKALAVAETTVKMADVTMNDKDSVTVAGITFTASGDNRALDVSAVATYLATTLTPGQTVNAASVGGLSNITASGTLLANHTYAATGDYLTITNTDNGATKYTAATKIDASGDNVMTAFSNWVNRDMDVNKNASSYGSGVLSFGASSSKIDIDLVANAQQAITEIDAAINGAAAERSKYGAYMSRLQYAADNLSNVATNTAASRSQIADADYASETTELARAQIISQASTAMLAQANQAKQTVLSLLQ